MGLFDHEESKTEEINKQRAQLKKTMSKNLKDKGFTAEEVKEVLEILEDAERDIQMKKDSLEGSNINNDHTLEIMDKVFYDIRQLELKMAADVRAKIAEIVQRKAK